MHRCVYGDWTFPLKSCAVRRGKKVCSIPSVSEADLGKWKVKRKIYFNCKIVAFLLLWMWNVCETGNGIFHTWGWGSVTATQFILHWVRRSQFIWTLKKKRQNQSPSDRITGGAWRNCPTTGQFSPSLIWDGGRTLLYRETIAEFI